MGELWAFIADVLAGNKQGGGFMEEALQMCLLLAQASHQKRIFKAVKYILGWKQKPDIIKNIFSSASRLFMSASYCRLISVYLAF